MRLGLAHAGARQPQGALDLGAALEEAQDQLEWGTEIDDLRAAAWALEMLSPAHPLIRRIDLKIARLRSSELPRGGPPLPRI